MSISGTVVKLSNNEIVRNNSVMDWDAISFSVQTMLYRNRKYSFQPNRNRNISKSNKIQS